MKKYSLFLFFCLFLLSGCQKYYLTIYQQKVNQDSLASTYVGTPDPRQKNPPKGQELIVEWQIPKDVLKKNPKIYLTVIYRDYSEAQFIYPISYKSGYVVYSLLDGEFDRTKGLLSYKAEIRVEEGEVFRFWQHQLWVNIIRLEDSKEEVSESLPSKINEDAEESSATFFPPTF